MSKKLYQVGFSNIKQYISQYKDIINKYIKNKEKHELAKVFGRSYYEIAIKRFFTNHKIERDPKYAIQILNIFKSEKFIYELYSYLGLDIFVDQTYSTDLNISSLKDYEKSIFYSFIYFLHIEINPKKDDIQRKLFTYYFLHHVSTINTKTNININYKNLILEYIKGKDISIKESYTTNNDTENIVFKILVNNKTKVTLEGKSIKTLRKRANKKVYLYLLDTQ